MAESKAENKKVEVVKGEEKNGAVRRPIESANIFTSNGVISFSVWEGGSISVRVSRRKDGSDEYENVWSGRINPVDFISQIGELRSLAKTAQDELKKILGMEI